MTFLRLAPLFRPRRALLYTLSFPSKRSGPAYTSAPRLFYTSCIANQQVQGSSHPTPPEPETRAKAPYATRIATVLIGSGIAYYLFADVFTKFKGQGQVNSSPVAGLNNVYGTATDFQKAIAELTHAFPEELVSTDQDDLETHGFSENDYHPGVCTAWLSSLVTLAHCDNFRLAGSNPTVVVWPSSTADVVKIVNISRKYRMPIIPYSGATSLEGHYRAVC